MDRLRDFVSRLRDEGPRLRDEGPEGLAWGELDVVEMYPNVRKFLVPVTVKFFWTEFKPEVHEVHTHNTAVVSHSQMGSKTHSKDQAFSHLPIDDMFLFTHLDLLFNDQFVHLTSVLKHTLGVTIGGSA